MGAIRNYAENPAWGNPRNYVFSISRTGEGYDAKYSVIAEPPVAPPDEEILASMTEARIDCREIFRGENPFGALTEDDTDDEPF